MQSGCGLQSRIGLLEKQEALFKQFEVSRGGRIKELRAGLPVPACKRYISAARGKVQRQA